MASRILLKKSKDRREINTSCRVPDLRVCIFLAGYSAYFACGHLVTRSTLISVCGSSMESESGASLSLMLT